MKYLTCSLLVALINEVFGNEPETGDLINMRGGGHSGGPSGGRAGGQAQTKVGSKVLFFWALLGLMILFFLIWVYEYCMVSARKS